jgi:hypothetical protein
LYDPARIPSSYDAKKARITYNVLPDGSLSKITAVIAQKRVAKSSDDTVTYTSIHAYSRLYFYCKRFFVRFNSLVPTATTTENRNQTTKEAAYFEKEFGW